MAADKPISIEPHSRSNKNYFPFKLSNPFMGNNRPRTSQDMDETLTLIFANSKTTWDFVTKFAAFLQLRKIWILSKFEECSSKIGPTTPFRIFLHFWRELQILSTYDLNFLHKAGFHRGWQLVKIWCWYLQPLLRNSKLTNFIFFSVT